MPPSAMTSKARIAVRRTRSSGTTRACRNSKSTTAGCGKRGWAGPPRFPQPAVVDLLLRHGRVVPDDRVLRTAIRALDVMADGGIHDQVGGGFHRYATDTDWLVPHFEKMLYDNAQLARVYLHAYQLTGERRFRDVVETTLDFMVREMRTRDGLFAASQDADTDGVEGGTYVWTRDEVAAVLDGAVANAGPGPQ